TVQFGFPHRPSAIAYDPKLRLLAIGTQNGVIRVYGQPGVEFTVRHMSDVVITHLFFLPGQGRIISIGEDNMICMWEINTENQVSQLGETKRYLLDGKYRISACCLDEDAKHLYIGTDAGNIYDFDVAELTLVEDPLIHQDAVLQNVSDDNKVNPGPIESITQNPSDSNQLLVGYNRGFVALYDLAGKEVVHVYMGTLELESLCWHKSGTQFISAHNDGSFAVWNVNDPANPEHPPSTPYGPFPCKAINKIAWATSDSDPYIIFSGGMARASHGDRHCVTVMQGKKHIVFDFTSPVCDFIPFYGDNASEDTRAVVILLEEELVMIDLYHESFPLFQKPYLSSPHVTPITTSAHISDCPQELLEKIRSAGTLQCKNEYSDCPWPIDGGQAMNSDSNRSELLLTGHQDGSIRFWDVSNTSLQLLYTLSTSSYFITEGDEEDGDKNEEEDNWPPFRKVGSYDPFSDDARLAILHLHLCTFRNTLVAAGAGGQVLVFELSEEATERELEPIRIDLPDDQEFRWGGMEQLMSRKESITMQPGFQATHWAQLYPPDAVTALAVHTEWELIAVGCGQGYGMFDYNNGSSVWKRWTYGIYEKDSAINPFNRSKSFRRSMRNSVRRARSSFRRRGGAGGNTPKKSGDVETTGSRRIEPREEASGSLVRSLYFANTLIREGYTHGPTLWAGTNLGSVFVDHITLPDKEARSSEKVKVQEAKIIQLEHRAPIVDVLIADTKGSILPEPFEVEFGKAKKPASNGAHYAVIVSEEQIKVYSLPSFKFRNKEKLTVIDGSRVAKSGLIRVRGKFESNNAPGLLGCLTNRGELVMYTVPDLRLVARINCIGKDNAIAKRSAIVSRNGQGFYLQTPSELQRFCITKEGYISSDCVVEVDEMYRQSPVKAEPEGSADG
ncbi:uncharacterized protein TRIADDRAFT_31093, partial [Trichoplax adhaerens]